MKRIALFLATNLAIVLVLSLSARLLGLEPYLSAQGLDLGALLAFAALMGFGGSFLSLALSKWTAKRAMGVRVIETPANATESWLVQTVRRQAEQAGIGMPEVGVYDADEVNAFATGPTKNRALVAVSTGLLRRMRREEIEGVLGHEIAHVANGDMVTMTLVQGVINVFVMFFARVIAFAVVQFMRRDDDRGGSFGLQFIITFVLEIVLSLLGAIAVAAFSRWREFRADAGGARVAGRGNMISALQALQRSHELVDTQHQALATLKINGKRGGLAVLFATHPPLEERIARLQNFV